MSIAKEHAWLHEEALTILRQRLGEGSHVIVMGRQIIRDQLYPDDTVAELFRSWGWLASDNDMFADDADMNRDLNEPQSWDGNQLVWDCGTLEHIADTRTALGNYLHALGKDGLLFLLTPIKGYYDHGFHTFSPEFILETLKLNGMRIDKAWYAAKSGERLESPDDADDVVIALIATKIESCPWPIRMPQQKRWVNHDRSRPQLARPAPRQHG